MCAHNNCACIALLFLRESNSTTAKNKVIIKDYFDAQYTKKDLNKCCCFQQGHFTPININPNTDSICVFCRLLEMKITDHSLFG